MGRQTIYNYITTEEKLAKINTKNIELMNDFLDYLVSVDRAEKTIHSYKSDLRIFFTWNMENNNNKYFPELIKREIAKFQKHALSEWEWSPNRLSRVKSAISSLSNYIENILDDEIEGYRSIVRKIESPVKQNTREKTVITNDEVDMILDTLVESKKYQQAAVFALAAFSGSRKTELLRFKSSYFNDANIMKDAALYKTPEKIKTKGRGSSGKLLNKYTLLDFKKYFDLWMNERKERGITDCEYLFVKPNTGELLKESTLDSFTLTISEILGRPFYFHALRHQLATRLSKLNIPSNVIVEYFGWTTSSMLEIYDDSEASDDFGKFFTDDGIKAGEKKGFGDI